MQRSRITYSALLFEAFTKKYLKIVVIPWRTELFLVEEDPVRPKCVSFDKELL